MGGIYVAVGRWVDIIVLSFTVKVTSQEGESKVRIFSNLIKIT